MKAVRGFPATLVLFESSHRIDALLSQLDQVFGDKSCVVAKELTKLYERFLRGSASELLQPLEQEPLLRKGEFVVLVDNAAASEQKDINNDERELLKLLVSEVSLKAAVKIAVQITGKKKNDLYQMALQLQDSTTSHL